MAELTIVARSLHLELATELRRRLERPLVFDDGRWGLVHGSIADENIDPLRAWLESAGVVAPRLRLGDHAQAHRIAGLPTARCPECDSGLRFEPSFACKSDDDQLACDSCGGMFNVGNVLTGTVLHLVDDNPVPSRGSVAFCFDPKSQERVTVGRGRSDDFFVRSGAVTKRQGAFLFESDRFVCLDLQTENGIRLNGRPIPRGGRVALAKDDVLEFPGLFYRVAIVSRR